MDMGNNLFELIDGKMKFRCSLSGKQDQTKGIRHVFYDLETVEDLSRNYLFKAVSISTTFFDERDYGKKISKCTENELIAELKQNK